MPPLHRFTQSFTQAADRLYVRSALNPALWMCAIVTIACGVLAVRGPAALQTWFMVLASMPVAVACFGYLYFMFFDPKRLHSEDYQLRSRALDIIQEKDGGPITLLPVELEKITNPEKRSLRGPQDEYPQ